jgi:hypothetical protein
LSLSPHSTFCTFFPLLPPIPTFSLLVPTSKSRHHFSFSCTLSPQVLPVVSGFFDSFPSFLLVCGFVSFTQLYIHPSSFCSQSFRFFTGKPVSSQFHSFSSLFLFLLLNTIIFVFSTFTSSFFFLTYFHRLCIISFISLSLFATITKFLPTTLPSACAFFTISSISATCIVNSRRLSGHPCLTPFVVSPSLLYLS